MFVLSLKFLSMWFGGVGDDFPSLALSDLCRSSPKIFSRPVEPVQPLSFSSRNTLLFLMILLSSLLLPISDRSPLQLAPFSSNDAILFPFLPHPKMPQSSFHLFDTHTPSTTPITSQSRKSRETRKRRSRNQGTK